MPHQPFALYVRGPKDLMFDLSDRLGFQSHMEALAVSLFEDDPANDIFCVQALYETQAEADNALSGLALSADIEAFISELPDEDWVSISQKGLPPVEAGRFWIYGGHDKDKTPANTPWPIHIEAGPAFGTGHHGTTKGCLLIFDELLMAGSTFEKILDLGCGAGTLAIAAAMATGTHVLGTDIDQDAVDVTLENAAQNKTQDLIKAYQADGFDSPALKDQKFDLIFANILAGPLMGLAPDISAALLPGGHVILSGILTELADTVTEVFEGQDIAIKKGPALSGWTSLHGIKT